MTHVIDSHITYIFLRLSVSFQAITSTGYRVVRGNPANYTYIKAEIPASKNIILNRENVQRKLCQAGTDAMKQRNTIYLSG
jgi:hypothetical protein